MQIDKIIGQTVIAIKGEFSDEGLYIEPSYILFSDKETLIHLTEQDYDTYHDCSTLARELNISKDPLYWQDVFDNCPDATMDI